jgi:hypothetical protein
MFCTIQVIRVIPTVGTLRVGVTREDRIQTEGLMILAAQAAYLVPAQPIRPAAITAVPVHLPRSRHKAETSKDPDIHGGTASSRLAAARRGREFSILAYRARHPALRIHR